MVRLVPEPPGLGGLYEREGPQIGLDLLGALLVALETELVAATDLRGKLTRSPSRATASGAPPSS